MTRAVRMDRAASTFVHSSVSARRWKIAAALVMALILWSALPGALHAQNFGQKNLQGKVFDGADQPITGAIVYLKNSRNNDVKTYLSEKDGSYRFAGLSADTDYTVWAAYHGKKGDNKTVSSFDSRKLVYLDLKVK
jgi:Carboxypeptidase regulatory-like domain